MTVYADVVFLINFVSSYMMLYILGKIINNFRIKKRQMFVSSVVGGASATVIFCVEMSVTTGYILRLISVFLMLFIAFFDVKRQILHQFACLLLLTGIMVFSMLIVASVMCNSFGMVMKSGILYFNLPYKVFICAFVGAYVLTVLFTKLFKGKRQKKCYILTVTHNDKTIDVTALFDSGNRLREPITKRSVHIVEWNEVKKLFCAEWDFCEIENHAEDMKLWVVPFNSLGNPSGMIFAFMADRIDVFSEHKTADKAFVGIYNGELSKNGEYHALINADLF